MSRSALRAARIAYLALVAVLVVTLVISRWDALLTAIRGARPAWLVAAFVATFGTIWLGAIIWNRTLAGLGHDVPVEPIVVATARSVMARYIPGSVWFAVGRVGLLRAHGHDAAALSATALLEIALSLCVAIGLGALILGAQAVLPGGLVWVFAAIGILAVASSPPVLGRMLGWVAARRGSEMQPLSWRTHLVIVGWMVAFWLWSAVGFLLYLRAFPTADGFDAVTVLGGFMLSWGIGFLAVFAPQGIGVAEASLAAILGSDDLTTLALLIGGFRAVILVRDVTATAAGEIMRSRGAPRGSERTD